jgi:membrane-bound serine protease (ClpP class)
MPQDGSAGALAPASPAVLSRPPRRQPSRLRGILVLAVAAFLAFGMFVAPSAARADGSHVDLAHFTSDVNPAASEYIQGAVDRAQSDGATTLVIELDTFGGDLSSMETIVEKELRSTLPIVVYVGPSGAHADSAGAYVALAAPLVAMSPVTRIGSASPVDVTGQDLPPTEKAKTTNALVALIRREQQTFGRNADLAEQMVTQATAFNEQDAVADNIVNLTATSLTDLLQQIDGRAVTLANGTNVTLATAGLPVQTLDPTARDQLLGVLLDPNLLFLLFIVAAVCIYIELSHPGAIVPGTVGAIALLLFLFGAGSLSPNWTGLALMLLAIVLLAIDVRVPTHGVLTAGALISLVVGSLIFFNSGPADLAINPFLVIGVAAAVGVIAAIVIRFAIVSQRAKVDTGREGLIGQVAVATETLAPEGRVRVRGELWSASLEDPAAGPVPAGGEVRVVAVHGLRLIVRPVPAVTPAQR